MKRAFSMLLVALVCGATARAEVIDAAPGGFSLVHEVTIAAPRDKAWRAAVDEVGRWWSSDHTISGDATRMSIDPQPQGCFCEAIGEHAGVVGDQCAAHLQQLVLVDEAGAVVVVGDGNGYVGHGLGKANEVANAISKGTEDAKKHMIHVPRVGTTVPHDIKGVYGAGKVLIMPAQEGTGVIAGGGVRAVLEAAGIRNILTKSQGSPNLLNVAMATMKALEMLRSPEEMAQMRGKEPEELLPFWERARLHQQRQVIERKEAPEAAAEGED
mgnify:CR=1 FL=1